MKYQEFIQLYHTNRNLNFSKFQKTFFQVQELIEKTYDITLENKFRFLIENKDLNTAATLISVMDIYKSLFIKSNTSFLPIAS